jgi:hypothetical protein
MYDAMIYSIPMIHLALLSPPPCDKTVHPFLIIVLRNHVSIVIVYVNIDRAIAKLFTVHLDPSMFHFHRREVSRY